MTMTDIESTPRDFTNRKDPLVCAWWEFWDTAAPPLVKLFSEYMAYAVLAERQRAIPLGWKIVPREPTEEMFEAGESTFHSGYTGTPTSSPDVVYKAMLAASPKPPTTEIDT